MAQVIKDKQDMTHLSWTHIRSSSGTAGSFLKATDDLREPKVYYKLSNYDNQRGVTGHECVNEIIADRLLSILGVEHLNYSLIHADIIVEGRKVETYLCASEDFKKRGETKVALDVYYGVEKRPDETPLSYRTVAITRGGETIIPRQGEIFTEGDVIYVIARQDAVKQVMEFSGQSNIEIKNMMILGGSRIGIRIATELQEEVNIKLVDYNAEKAYRLAELLDKTLIINEDGRNTEAMMEEGLSNMDAFVAVTGRSETNILAAMLAKRMGVKKVIAEVENLNYINLAESIGIDTIINKKLVTASNIFRFTMSTDVQAIKCLTGSDAEVLEFIVKPNAPAVKTRIKDMGLPEDTIIGGIVRGDKVFIAVDNMEINPYDRVVVFAMPASVGKVGYFFN